LRGIGRYSGEGHASFTIEQPFCDVTPSTSHYEDILWLYSSSISTGWGSFPNREFRGMNTVIRQDMAAFLFRMAVKTGVADPNWQPTPAQKARFSDVNDSTPHAREIWWLAASGISEGWKLGDHYEFRPRNTVVRQDLAAFLFRLACKSDPSLASWSPSQDDIAYFSDVSSRTPHAREIWWMAANGISAGWTMKDGTHQFRGTSPVVRQDMAAFLHRLYEG
jgi:hypothetical protein